MILDIDRLSKKYRGGKRALRDFSLQIEEGVLGLLGPNGAGKSTLMKIIATVSKATEGRVTIDGIDIGKSPNAMRKQLGFLPQDFGVYPNLNAFEFLEYIAAMKGVGGKGIKDRIAGLLEAVNLQEVARNPIGSYSGGMKQRIGIAQALLNDPKVLIFDEPMVGLDPEERMRFRNLIAEMGNDRIVILSSHIVSDVSSIADKVVVMKEGELLFTGDQDATVEHVQGKVFELFIDRNELDSYKEKYLISSTNRTKGGLRIRIITDEMSPNFESVDANLEDAYLWLTKSNVTV